jgi:hypothetical protein
MAEFKFQVHVERINESANKSSSFEVSANSIEVSEQGDLHIKTPNGGKSMTSGTWGSVTIINLPLSKNSV